jgi:hypothetical protein
MKYNTIIQTLGLGWAQALRAKSHALAGFLKNKIGNRLLPYLISHSDFNFLFFLCTCNLLIFYPENGHTTINTYFYRPQLSLESILSQSQSSPSWRS